MPIIFVPDHASHPNLRFQRVQTVRSETAQQSPKKNIYKI